MSPPGEFRPYGARFDPPPRARTTDPITSLIAADALERAGRDKKQRILALLLVRTHPGHTSRELAHMACPTDKLRERDVYDALHRRLPELRNRCKVDNGPAPRKCTVSGRPSVTWFPREPRV